MANRDQEDRFYRQVLDAFSTWLGRVTTLVLAGFRRTGGRPDPDAMYAATGLWTSLVDKMITTLVTDSGSDEIRMTDVAKSEWLNYQMETTRNLLVNIPNEVHQLIVEQIAQGTAAGENQSEIAARIDHILSTTGSDRWPNRAKLIAVTEVHRSANLAVQAAGQIMQANQREPILKQWNSLDDEKVRPDHMEVDKATIPIAKQFMVGGFPMLCPGDPSAPADQVCNCRCNLKLIGVQQ